MAQILKASHGEEMEDTGKEKSESGKTIAESFLFVPFRIRTTANYESYLDELTDRKAAEGREEDSADERIETFSRNYGWRLSGVSGAGKSGQSRSGSTVRQVRYILRYVQDRVNSPDLRKRQCLHFKVEENAYKKIVPAGFEQEFRCVKNDAQMNIGTFRIADVHLYLFSTGVGMAAFLLKFSRPDAKAMTDVLFHLKRAAEKTMVEADSVKTGKGTYGILSLAKSLTEELQKNQPWEFFFYAAHPADFRCNTLSLLKCSPEEETPGHEIAGGYLKQLYFLRHAYDHTFRYMRDSGADAREVFRTSEDRIWGIAAEGAACLAPARSEASEYFIDNIFLKNFETYYLFMFVLTLHQKYELYRLLTKMTMTVYERPYHYDTGKTEDYAGEQEEQTGELTEEQQTADLERLEKYQSELYWFEKDFSFAVISETPQYQIVYEKLREAFNLDKMYEDVREPLLSLSELRRKRQEDAVREQLENDRKQERRERQQNERMNTALNALSSLAIFSALVDGFDLVRELIYGDGLQPIWRFPEMLTWILLIALVAGILIWFLKNVIIPMRRGDREDPHESRGDEENTKKTDRNGSS